MNKKGDMKMEEKIINLTPHIINVGDLQIQSHGICRAEEKTTEVGFFGGIQLIKKEFGEIENLPAPERNTKYVVSIIVAIAAKGTRNDLLVPGEVVRDEKGKIIGCKSLSIV